MKDADSYPGISRYFRFSEQHQPTDCDGDGRNGHQQANQDDGHVEETGHASYGGAVIGANILSEHTRKLRKRYR